MSITVLHAGLHKTGTTTLQDWLANHAEWLAQRGIYYPIDGSGLSGAHKLACWLSARRDAGGPNDLFLQEREKFAAELGTRASAVDEFGSLLLTNLRTRLISSELFCTFNANELSRLKETIGPVDKLVLYVRNGVQYIYSCWATKVRWGCQSSFDGFLSDTLKFASATPLIGALRFVECVLETLRESALHVRSFDTALDHRFGLIGDFLECELELPFPDSTRDDRVANASPAPEITEFRRAGNIIAASQPGVGVGRLRAAIRAVAASEVLRTTIAHALNPLIHQISIEELGSPYIDRDGSIRPDTTRSAHLFECWKFPLYESAPWIATEPLMRAVEAHDLFRRAISEANGS